MYSQAYVRAPQVAPKLDNAGRLRVMYFIDPADAEFKETVTNAWRKWEVPMPAAMPCKIREESTRTFVAILILPRQKYACIVEADESARKRLEGALHKYHEDHIEGRGIHSLSHYNLVRKIILMPQSMKYQMRKQQWKKNGKNSRKYRHGS